MNRYKIIVVDDERLTRERIVSLLSNYNKFEVVKEASNGVEAVNYIKTYKPDIIFLDIKMPKLNGFEVLQRVKKSDFKFLVFITAFDNFALKAFENEALDYLLKPFDRKRFRVLMERIERNIELLNTPEEKILIVKEKNELFRLKIKDIVYIKAENNYVSLVLNDGLFKKRISIKNISEKLDENFLRVHRSYIINKDKIQKMRHVKSGDYLFLMSNEKTVFSSKSYRSNVQKLIT
ncbi:response regulator [Winogradskyella sp. 3972H.M.0a.05]|uniref:LytR/AlgR family response regulator transcription factor n=1 Tax=Winogradskyella sp. 3972H.M.0a.05 TaxID=2950277 RepID=UPI0033948588